VRDKDSNEQPFIPLWYPLYASIGDFFNPPVDEPLFDAMKKLRWQNLRLFLCMRGNENEDGYEQANAAIDTVNKNLEQYRQNEREIDDMERLLKKTAGEPASKEIGEKIIQEQHTVKDPQTDPAKVTLNWLRSKKRQYIIKHTEPDRSVLRSGALEFRNPPKTEWRITKPAAFIYRRLCEAAEKGEIPFAKDAIADFMINRLKRKDGKDITKDSLTKADNRTNPDKSRQIKTK
jgi:hypothetical protein